MNPINTRIASIEELQLSIGRSLKDRIENRGSMTEFIDAHDVGKTTLYRLFAGDGISLANLIRILRGLEMYDVLDALTAPAPVSPVAQWQKDGKAERIKRHGASERATAKDSINRMVVTKERKS